MYGVYWIEIYILTSCFSSRVMHAIASDFLLVKSDVSSLPSYTKDRILTLLLCRGEFVTTSFVSNHWNMTNSRGSRFCHLFLSPYVISSSLVLYSYFKESPLLWLAERIQNVTTSTNAEPSYCTVWNLRRVGAKKPSLCLLRIL